MDRAERNGLVLALAGHVLLFGALSIGLMMRPEIRDTKRDFMDVQLVGPIGLESATPNPATEAPAESEAPEQGPPEEAAAEPAPSDAPAIAPKPDSKPAEKPTPAPKRERLSDDFLKTVRDTAATEKKAKGARLGSDFLKGITPEKTAGKGSAPRASLTGQQMAGLAAAIAAQVRPCYNVPTGGADALRIITVLRLQFRRDGSPAGNPTVVDHTGVTPSNQGYVRQMDEAARRAVLRCAPLKLPANLYEGGWDDIEFVFNPQAME